jgi:hypothetical protein
MKSIKSLSDLDIFVKAYALDFARHSMNMHADK